MKSQIKIGIFFFIFSLLIILSLGGAIYYFTDSYSYTDFYKRLELRALIAAKYNLEEEETHKTETFREIREQHMERLPEEQEFFFKIHSQTSFAEISIKHQLPVVFFEELARKNKATYKRNNRLYSGIIYTNKKGKYAVVVSAENYYASHHLAYLRNILIVSISLTSLLALFIAIYLSKNVFIPVKKITQRVKEISSDNIHLRLEDNPKNDEVGELIVTFNHLLDRLETAFETQKNFISNASHELVTPLTAIIGEADVALQKKRSPEVYEDSLKVILNEAERLDKITKSLLFLARSAYDGNKLKMDVIRVDQLVWDVKDTIDIINPKNQIFIDLGLVPDDPKKLKIKGNIQLLHLAISNIVSNACKYSSNKPVKISIGTTQHEIILIIKDEGIGIPEAEIQYIYDPFFRASNTGFFEGYGIGLPLARNIIRQHNSTISVSSVINQGTTIQINFPLHIIP